MLRTLNFTGRRKITLEEVRISLRKEGVGNMVFDAELELSEFPPNAQVFIEAYFKTTTERFSWGTVGELTPPLNRQLRKIAQPELAHFRVKVVEPYIGGIGRLLGIANNISPEGLQGTGKRVIPLFRVNPTDGLQDKVWHLDFDDGGPILNLNRGVAGIKERVREEAFMALVFPAVMKDIFKEVFEDRDGDPDDDQDGWQGRWLRFGARLSGRANPSLEEGKTSLDEWIEDAIAAWSKRQKIVSNYKKLYKNSEGDGK